MDATYSTSSSAWTLAMPCTRAIPSLSSSCQHRNTNIASQSIQSHHHAAWDQRMMSGMSHVAGSMRLVSCCRQATPQACYKTYPTDRTRPVSARPDSSWTPRILCSRMDETSVGEALASAYVRVWRAATAGAAFRCRRLVSLAEYRDTCKMRDQLPSKLPVLVQCLSVARGELN